MLISEKEWRDWLFLEEGGERLDVLHKHVEKVLPCESNDFVKALADQVGRVLEYRFQGRAGKQDNEKG